MVGVAFADFVGRIVSPLPRQVPSSRRSSGLEFPLPRHFPLLPLVARACTPFSYVFALLPARSVMLASPDVNQTVLVSRTAPHSFVSLVQDVFFCSCSTVLSRDGFVVLCASCMQWCESFGSPGAMWRDQTCRSSRSKHSFRPKPVFL